MLVPLVVFVSTWIALHSYSMVDNIVTSGICVGTVEKCRDGASGVPAPALQVLFRLKSAELSASATDELSKFTDDLRRKSATATLVVRGFADTLGDEQSNLNLSKRRAQSVADFLIRQGVDVVAIEVLAKGEVTDGYDEIRNPRNRRVDLSIAER